MTIRKAGRIAIELLAGALVILALASLAGVPARFTTRQPDEGTTGNDRGLLIQPAGAGGSPSPTPTCEQPTTIGKVVVASVSARKAPSSTAPVIATYRRVNAQGAPQVFDLGPSIVDSAGDIWFRALLPIRPNGTMGYIPAGSVQLTQTPYRIVVDRHKLRLTVSKGCRQVMQLRIGLGKESTPTPNGTFYIISLLRPPLAGSVYGTYAYGLSAFSNAVTIKSWEGGGIIGLHGTNDPASIGNRQSHGCIRMYNWDIAKLVPILPLGTPVEIR